MRKFIVLNRASFITPANIKTYEEALALARVTAVGGTPVVIMEAITEVERDTPPVVVRDFVGHKG